MITNELLQDNWGRIKCIEAIFNLHQWLALQIALVNSEFDVEFLDELGRGLLVAAHDGLEHLK